MNKYRVWWITQIGTKTFYVPVNTIEEGKKLLDTFAAYDLFQLQNRIRPDFANVGGLEMWNEEEQDWEDWYFENDTEYYDDLKEYFGEHENKELLDYSDSLFSQIDFDRIEEL